MTEQEIKNEILAGLSEKSSIRLVVGQNTEPDKIFDAVSTVGSYTIAMCYHIAKDIVERTEKELKGHKLCTRLGFKNELKMLRTAIQADVVDTNILFERESGRLLIMCREIIPYCADFLPKLYYSTENFIARYGCSDKKLLARAIVCQAIIDRMSVMCQESWIIMAKAKVSASTDASWRMHVANKTVQTINRYKLSRSNKQALVLSQRVAQLIGDTKQECNINDCKDLFVGLNCIEKQIRDLDLLSLHSAYSLEQTMGSEHLLKTDPESYKLLHPNYKLQQ